VSDIMETRNKIVVKKVSFFYGQNQVLNNINATFSEHTLTAIMGPSGEGKSTFLGLFNRLWDDIPGARVEGEVR
jgi:phosphate transport system ATP-binding protein